MKKENRLLTEELIKFDGTQCVHIPKKISPEKLTEMYWWLNQKVFSMKSIIYRTIFNKYLWKNFKMLLFSIGINMHYRHYIQRKITPNIF
jgi:hypothetical protein